MEAKARGREEATARLRLARKLSASILSSLSPNWATLPSVVIANLLLGAAGAPVMLACMPAENVAGAGMGTCEPSGPSTSLKKATRLAVSSGNVGRS